MTAAGRKIIRGLEDAIAFARGDTSRGTLLFGAGWRSIDSAPMDGQVVDLLYPNGLVLEGARYVSELEMGWVARRIPDESPDAPPEEWDFVSYPCMEPTHWRQTAGVAVKNPTP